MDTAQPQIIIVDTAQPRVIIVDMAQPQIIIVDTALPRVIVVVSVLSAHLGDKVFYVLLGYSQMHNPTTGFIHGLCSDMMF